MARQDEKMNQAAANTYGQQEQTANTAAQGDISQFNQNQATLNQGKNVAANPYLNPQYLAATQRLQAGALNQNTNAADQQVRRLNLRTGGMNNTATTGEIGNRALQKAQLGSELSAGRTANDWQKNIGYQLGQAQAPLEAAKAQTGVMGIATGGQSDALKNLTQFGLAHDARWAAAINEAIKAAGGAAAGGLSGSAGDIAAGASG